MADDIVTRLRWLQDELAETYVGDDLAAAVDEIERLRAALTNAVKSITNRERENDELHDDLTWLLQKVGRLRAAGDALAMDMRHLGGLDAAYDAPLRAWEEARRG